MKFIEASADLPNELIREVNDGEAVFLCGAGVSKGVGLPLFQELTDRVYIKLGESRGNEAAERIAYDRTEYDRVLRSLEKRTLLPGTNSRVRAAVSEILAPPGGVDLSRHLSLLRLSRDRAGRPRLLTTNFDTLFERAAHQNGNTLMSQAGKSLPRPGAPRDYGVLHLHGRLADVDLNLEETDLILTSADFGDAYLRDGWASQYVEDRKHWIGDVRWLVRPAYRFRCEVMQSRLVWWEALRSRHQAPVQRPFHMGRLTANILLIAPGGAISLEDTMRTQLPLGLLAAAFVCSHFASPADAAARDRTFVASYGTDSGSCTFGSPCKTFQFAINNTAVGGEVTAIDSAGFGPFTVSHAITITSPNGVEAGIATPSGGTAITITAESSTDIINLNGLTLDGVGGATTGIQFNSGGSLTVSDSVIRNFGSYDINFAPNATNPANLFVSNTLISDSENGINIAPTNTGAVISAIDHVKIQNTTNVGLNVGSSTQQVGLTFNDSAIVGNSNVAFWASARTYAVIRRSNISGNGSFGLVAGDGAVVRISQSIITDNAAGWFINSGVAQITSTGDNLIDGNLADNTQPTSTPYK